MLSDQELTLWSQRYQSKLNLLPQKQWQTPKSVNRDMYMKVIQFCDAAAAIIQMHI